MSQAIVDQLPALVDQSEFRNEQSEAVLVKLISDNLQPSIFEFIHTHYGESAPLNEQCMFHLEEHSKETAQRTEKVLRKFQENKGEITDKQIEIAKLVALLHDTVQGFDIVPSKITGLDIKKPHWGNNEKDTIVLVRALFEKVNQVAKQAGKQPLFSEEEMRDAEIMIAATEPTFDIQKGTIMQPNLPEAKTLYHRALALMDLGSAGMEPERYLADGNKLFRERTVWIEQLLRECAKDNRALLPYEKELMRQEIIDWQKNQVGFVENRKKYHEEELAGLTALEKSTVDEFFPVTADKGYTESKRLAEIRYRESATGDLYTLLADTFEFPRDLVEFARSKDPSNQSEIQTEATKN